MSKDYLSNSELWARFRFSVIGRLLVSPPAKGELNNAISLLCAQSYCHPITGEKVTLGYSTIERWYYQALSSVDPISVLSRKLRKDAGRLRALSSALLLELEKPTASINGCKYITI